MSRTPGPWEVREWDGDGWPDNRISVGPQSNNDATAVCISPKYGDIDVIRKDMRLIAAAPDLADALKEAVDCYGKPGGPWNVPSDPGGWLERARAALRKAGEIPGEVGG